MDAAKLNDLLSEPFDSLKTDVYKLQRLVSYHINIFGSTSCASCGGEEKYREYYSRLKTEGLMIMERQANARYVLKDGSGTMQLEFGSNRIISPANLTDELAVEFLAINPNRIVKFKKFPEDWQKDVDAFKSGKAVSVETPEPAAEVQAPESDEQPEPVAPSAPKAEVSNPKRKKYQLLNARSKK